MTKLTNYLENKLVDHVLRKTAYTSPTNVYVALHTADPTEAGNVAEVTTGAYPAYARQLLTVGAPTDGVGANSADLTWNVNAAITFSHLSIWDAQTGGNPLFYGALAASKTMANGDVFRIPAGSLTVGFD
ncbi:hypothetical protein J1P26_07420 [Neobacillus sp. MM2021_6]|uniref:phage tail fiber protein n=1 Tax=Bacillaceae TaxID=186817 RepID=UPI00140B3A8C|nr:MULTISPECIES: hypothetical protein [Bacillaceae]MBO0959562.1 hypothetical protein [Neobacillus sp. MM2021_6]NHC17140.1 hypothetical protein [Bacillus sp. MM2020_4]